MLQRIHQGHMGIEKSKRRARDVLYWPGMNSQISDMISRCTTCLEHQWQNTKEPMIPSRIPSKPWEMVATDLFTWDKSEYLVVVDYHSRYFEVAKLPDTKSTTVITYTKSVFARHGIPSEVISDNGPQYPLRDFSLFAKQWELKHTSVSPLYPQANGLAEKEVQIVKNLLTKSKQDRRDPYLGLLEYRNTPIDDVGSPVLIKSPESGSSATDISTHLESPTVKANEHSTSKEAANQAIPSVEEPISTTQEQGEINSSEEEIAEPLKTASGRAVRRPLRFKDYVM